MHNLIVIPAPLLMSFPRRAYRSAKGGSAIRGGQPGKRESSMAE